MQRSWGAKDIVRELERAYIGARYLPFKYEKDEAVRALKFVKCVFEKFAVERA
ncbi:HEPN domain-containing protein [Archaeoglobus sp.]|uniref:HEPN domain-containing protein n=1 Tax=Archaeoglobus sp. TaxID=1872626 RepID=UPI0025BEB054|nr:HEPN domain-containing protein [Archaeoglobus sp.]